MTATSGAKTAETVKEKLARIDAARRPRYIEIKEPAQSGDLPPVGFRIYGEDFDCLPIPRVLAMLDAEVANAEGNSMLALLEFLRGCLTAESLIRFEALLKDPARPVGNETLATIADAVAEQYRANKQTGEEAS